MYHITLQEFYFYSKVIGAVGSAVAAIYGAVRWLRISYQQAKKTGDNVTLLLENHLPHIMTSLDSHGDALGVLSSDIRDVSTKVEGMEQRQEDMRKGVHTLGESFLRHLENAAKESPKKKNRKS